MLACDGWSITTVEGLGDKVQGYHPIQVRISVKQSTSQYLLINNKPFYNRPCLGVSCCTTYYATCQAADREFFFTGSEFDQILLKIVKTYFLSPFCRRKEIKSDKAARNNLARTYFWVKATETFMLIKSDPGKIF